MGLHWGMYAAKEPETPPKVWDGIFKLIKDGKFRPITYTDKKYKGLDSTPRALIDLGSRATWGKVTVEIEEEPRSKL